MRKYLPVIVVALSVMFISLAVGNMALAHQNDVGAEEPEWWGKVLLPGLLGAGGLVSQWRKIMSAAPEVEEKLQEVIASMHAASSISHTSDPVKDLLADAARLMVEQDDLAGLDALSALLKARKRPLS